jgi:DNA-binding NtrC family response regulator
MPGTPPVSHGSTQANRGPTGGSLDPVVVRQGRQFAQVGPDGVDAAANWVLGRNVPMRRLARIVERAAEVECTVLFRGERGTGKELLARLLHRSGPRAAGPFVPVDCGGLAAVAAERQLFGDAGEGSADGERGVGLVRQADGGVLFLDEVDALPRSVQPRLLAVLESGELVSAGGRRSFPIDVQVVASTSRDLDVVVEAGAFHRRLYDRLNMLELRVPPLRERLEDLAEFVDFLSRRIAAARELPVWRPSAEVLAELSRLPWHGNVRQLEEAIGRFYLIAGGAVPSAAEAAPVKEPLATALAAMRDGRRRESRASDALGERVSQLLDRKPGGHAED